MANIQQENIPEYEDSLKGDSLLDPHGQEEPMELNEDILDQEGSAGSAEDEPNLLG